VRTLTQEQARRIAVRAQLLRADRPTDVMSVVRRLGSLQADPTKVVAPNAELVLWSRLGPTFDPAELEEARVTGRLVELRGHLHPAEDVALYRAEMAQWPFTGPRKEWQQGVLDWMEANDHTRVEILDKLRVEGALPATEFPDTTALPWESSGWNNDRNIRMMLGQLELRGEIATAGWEDRERIWDLAERVYPDDPVVPLEEAYAIRADRRLRALGVDLRRITTMTGLQLADDAGEKVRIEGVPGRWRVHPDHLDDDWEPRCALLSPLDRLVFDRQRMERLFGFDYQLEMYKPAAKRKWGYWAMPILWGEQLVGKLDATADHDAGVLHVDAVHEDGRWTKAMRYAVDAEIESLATWLDLTEHRSS